MQNFGTILKDWRGRRRLSQLALGLEADVSARHIAFLETGRSAPSRKMVLHLSDVLGIPRPERNTLLTAAGFAPAYPKRGLDDMDLAPLKAAIEHTITRHAPFPAIVIDRHWCLIDANAPARMLLTPFGIKDGDSLLKAIFEAPSRTSYFENWAEFGYYTAKRLRTESAHLGGVPELDRVVEGIESDAEVASYEPPKELPAIIPARYRAGEMVLSMFTTIAQFGSAEEISLADLRIELMFPADEHTRQIFEAMSAKGGAPS
ncbi:MAG: helix-turn-helix domain-containing protein [Pseudomonadota bacterium]